VPGKTVPLIPVDLALTGVLVPAGSNEVHVFYRSTWFGIGAAISSAALLLTIAVLTWGITHFGRARFDPAASH
jgi:uncharacterized membrane protein YfhO